MDRTDWNRPITKPKTKQEVHKEKITRHGLGDAVLLGHSSRGNKKETNTSDFYQQVRDRKKEERDEKNRAKRLKKSKDKARDESARNEVIWSPNKEEEQEEDYWTPGENRDTLNNDSWPASDQSEDDRSSSFYDQDEEEEGQHRQPVEPKPHHPLVHVPDHGRYRPAPPEHTRSRHNPRPRPETYTRGSSRHPTTYTRGSSRHRFEGQKDLGQKDDGRGVGPINPNPPPPRGNGQEDDGMGLRPIYSAPKHNNTQTQNGAVDHYGSTPPRKSYKEILGVRGRYGTLYYNKYIA